MAVDSKNIRFERTDGRTGYGGTVDSLNADV